MYERKISYTFQWCTYHSKIQCKYHIKSALKTRVIKPINPAVTGSTLKRRTDNSRCHQRRQSRQSDDPLLSVRKENNSISEHNKTMYISVKKTAIMGCEYFSSGALKTKGRQADNPFVTCSTVSCNDNAQYHQRRQRCQIDDPPISAREEKYYNNMADNLSKISRTFQSCRYHTKLGCEYLLTHWCLAAYVYTSVTQAVICSDNGVSPERHQAIILTNADILSTETPGRMSRNLETNSDTFQIWIMSWHTGQWHDGPCQFFTRVLKFVKAIPYFLVSSLTKSLSVKNILIT